MPSIETHPAFTIPPNRHCPIWRFLDFSKFVSLIDSGSLAFCRADLFDDPYEGSYTKSNISNRKELLRDTVDTEESFSQKICDLRSTFYINCWHMNEYESAAMWKIYCKSGDGVAIKSTYDRLHKSLPSETHIGIVNYIDYDTDNIDESNIFYAYLHKRKSFQHESELRALIWDCPPGLSNAIQTQPRIKLAKVDISTLIDKIYVSPAADDWYANLVSSITQKYGLVKEVIHSGLDSKPLY